MDVLSASPSNLFKESIMFDLETMTQLVHLIKDQPFEAVVLIVIILINERNRCRYVRRARLCRI